MVGKVGSWICSFPPYAGLRLGFRREDGYGSSIAGPAEKKNPSFPRRLEGEGRVGCSEAGTVDAFADRLRRTFQ